MPQGMPTLPAIPQNLDSPGGPSRPPVAPPPELLNAVDAQRRESHEKVRHATHQSLDAAREQTEQYVPRNVARINHNGVGSLDRLIRRQRAPNIRYEHIRDAQERGRWGKLLRMGLSMSFTEGNTIRGLGHAIEGLANMDHHQRVSVLRQLQQIPEENGDWRLKLAVASLRTAAERGLLAHGYQPSEGNPALQPQAVQEGDTLRSMIDRLFPDRATAIHEEIRNGAVAGVLTETRTLPPRTYVYFTQEGYPMAIGITPNEQHKVLLYRKTHEHTEADRDGTVEYLRRTLKPGDVLFFNDRHRSFVKRLFVSMGLLAQATSADEEENPFLHVGVYDEDASGEPIVHHVVEGGGKRSIKLKELLRTRYNTLAAGRLQNPDTAMRFLYAAQEVVQNTKRYDYSSLWRRMQHLFGRREGRDDGQTMHDLRSRPDAAVCVDVVSRAAQQVGNNELMLPNGRPAETAMDMLKQLTLVTAINIDETVVQPRGLGDRLHNFWFGKPPEAAQSTTFGLGSLWSGGRTDGARDPAFHQAA